MIPCILIAWLAFWAGNHTIGWFAAVAASIWLGVAIGKVSCNAGAGK